MIPERVNVEDTGSSAYHSWLEQGKIEEKGESELIAEQTSGEEGGEESEKYSKE